MEFNKEDIRDLIKQALTDINAGLEAKHALEAPEERFSEVEQTLKELFTDNYRDFIDDVVLVAPKPATFQVTIPNGNHIFLRWLGTSFEAQVEGKRYRLELHNEMIQALFHISEIFKYSPQQEAGSFDEFDEGGEAGSPGGGGDFGGGPTGDFSDLPAGDDDFGGDDSAEEEPEFT